MQRRRWFTIVETADHFKLSPKTIYSLIGRKRLPPGSVLRIGRQIRLDIKIIEDAAFLQPKPADKKIK